MEYSVVIPVFNESDSLVLLQERISATMEKLACEYEIIYVDDNSTDPSLGVLRQIKERYPKTKVLSLERHAGQSIALFAGFKASSGNWLITMDSDL